MVSSGRQAIACILLILGVAIYSQAQTTSAKEPTASISGKVTFKGKGVPGIMVMATDSQLRGWGRQVIGAPLTRPETTGFQIYLKEVISLVLMHWRLRWRMRKATNPVNIADGETIEDLNFVLVRGGVITGKSPTPTASH